MTDTEWAAAGAAVATTIRLVVWLLDRRDARRHREELARIEADSGSFPARVRETSTSEPPSLS